MAGRSCPNRADVLTNPKHTGHMVWNRHARKTSGDMINSAVELDLVTRART